MRTVLVLAFLFYPALAQAHYHLLLPDRHSVKEGDKVTITYAFGHPFEHELSDTQKPTRAIAFGPDGKETDLLKALEKVELPAADGKKAVAYKATFQPTGRGDFTILFESPALWMADEKHFVKDIARVNVHVVTQKGWANSYSKLPEFTLTPKTRPYGLRPGMVFQAVADVAGSHIFEIERYNPTPPKELPPDEHMTYVVHGDRDGIGTFTLPDAGWWAITATRAIGLGTTGPMREHEGVKYPLRERATLWVVVDDKVPLKPIEK